MGYAPRVARGFSPLDEELELLPGSLTPGLQESLVRLGAHMPFGQAAELLSMLTQVQVSETTVRRQSEAAGAAYVAVQTAAVERIERELPEAPAGPARQMLSVDGAMVPLVGGAWAEVKTLVLGEVCGTGSAVHSEALSYFSRLADAETFGHLALVETQRRGVEHAPQVCAVTDGAVWQQGFIDYHRPDALRILDFAHAAQRLWQVAHMVWGEGTAAARTWADQHCHRLKHEGPAVMLQELLSLVQLHPELPDLAGHLYYFQQRQAQMQYPDFQAQHWPIGSGAMESGNKLVVQARLKGAGMHWARQHVNPMLALRNVVCNDRWEEAWREITLVLRHKPQRTAHPATPQGAARQPAGLQPDIHRRSPPLIPLLPAAQAEQPQLAPLTLPAAPAEPRRPAPNHPWRCTPIGRARRIDPKYPPLAKS